MKITYTGRQVEVAPAQLKKLQDRLEKEKADAINRLAESSAGLGDVRAVIDKQIRRRA